MGFKQVKHRLQVAPGALHHGVSATFCDQPFGEPLKLAHDPAKLHDLRVGFVFAPPVMTQTTTNFLPTSMPAHRSRIASMICSSSADKQRAASWAYCSTGSEEAPVRCT